MIDTTQHSQAACPPPPWFSLPGAIGPMASVGVTVLDVPTDVSEAAVEKRLLAFLERLRAVTRARRVERLRTDGRMAVETFSNWADLGHRSAFSYQVRAAIRNRRYRSAPPGEDDGPDRPPETGGPARLLQGGDLFARLEESIAAGPPLTQADLTRITRRARAYADRRNATGIPCGEIDADGVERRLVAFLERLRARGRDRRLERLRTDGRAAVGMFRDWAGLDLRTISRMLEDGDVLTRMEDHVGSRPLLTPRDRARVTHRAKAYAERCNAIVNDALADLGKNKEETERVRKRLLRLAGPVPAAVIRDAGQADAIAAELHETMPWMGPATENAWHALRRSARDGAPMRLAPLLLDGPPGIGKTTWAHRLADILGVPSLELDASKGLASFSLTGTERGWGTAQPGRPLETMLDGRTANPLVIVDEVDKVGGLRGSSGISAAFTPALPGLLEPESARAWDCPYHRLRFDMSHISWVLTSNHLPCIPEPVLSRVRVLRLPHPTVEQLCGFARRLAGGGGLSDPAAEALVEAVERAGERWRLSLRDVNRMLARAVEMDSLPTVH